ncbi:hypothetical protein [Herbidospora sp. RD11066]
MSVDPQVRPSESPSRIDQLILARRDAFAAARDMYLTVVLGANVNVDSAGAEGFDRTRPVFIQYMNPEVLACYGFRVNGDRWSVILKNALSATRVALLVTDRYLVLPSSYIFEISWFDRFLASTEPLVTAGHIRYTSPVSDLAEYRNIKTYEYRHDPVNPYRSFDSASLTRHGQLTWTPRHGRSTATDIAGEWRGALAPGKALHPLVRGISERANRRYGRVERDLAKAPERLSGQAFIQRFVESVLPSRITGAESSSLAFFLSAAYLESYIVDLNATMLVDFPFGDLSCGVRQSYPRTKSRLASAQVVNEALQMLWIHDYIHKQASWDELLKLRSSLEFQVVLAAISEGVTLGLRLAVVVTRRSAHFRIATSYEQVGVNVAMVAEQLAAFADHSGSAAGKNG